MFSPSLTDLLFSSGPIALNELVMRLPQGPGEVASHVGSLYREGLVRVSGPLASKLAALTPDNPSSLNDDEILSASDTIIEPSSKSLYRSIAS